jgi:nitroreductase
VPPTLDLSPDELLSTTRTVRKRLDLDRPVPMELVRECLDLATQAPSGSNMQGWHFVVVTDEATRAALGEIYAKAFEIYRALPMAAGNIEYDDPARAAEQARVFSSAEHLGQNLGRCPVLLVPCIEGKVDGMPNVASSSMLGSIIPAAWSFCLAARARGLGTAWTTMHLMFEQEAADVLGIPFDTITQAALIPVAFTKGTDFKPGPRVDLDSILHVDTW